MAGANVEELVELRCVEVRRRAEPREPGVVDEDVDVSCLGHQALYAFGATDIGRDESRPSARQLNLLDYRSASVGVPSVDENGRPLGRELNRNGTADAGRCSRDERDLALKVVAGCGWHGVSNLCTDLSNSSTLDTVV
jgi:hypothetical protein